MHLTVFHRSALSILFFFASSLIAFSRVVYVSANGNDNNTGSSERTPIQTIELAIERGDTILLKRGDVFFSKGLKLNGKCMSVYGDGTSPIVSGYKRVITPSWEKVGASIWRLNLTVDNFSGVIETGSRMSNNIGCLHEYDKDLIHGRKVQYYSELKKDWDIWQTERFDSKTPASEFDWVYLYYEGNPNQLKLEFSITDAAVIMQNATIDGVSFRGYGFGISAKSNSVIKNCEIDAIGGRIQIGHGNYTCYGNGIEFYVSKDIENCLVENCVISRCYDCGITIQASDCRQATPRNIIIRNNLITECCQGWEDFLRNDENVVYENCLFENNVLLNNGNTAGFGYPESRFKYCQVLGNNFKGNKGMIIRNNTFVGGNYYCSGAYNKEYRSNVWEGNTCVIKRGDFILSNYTGSKDVIRIPTERGNFPTLSSATNDAIRRYRELTGDYTTRFVIKSERSINRRIKRERVKKHFIKQ